MQDVSVLLTSSPVQTHGLVLPSRLRVCARTLTGDRGVLIEAASITWCAVDALWCAWYFVRGRSTSHQHGSDFLQEIVLDLIGIAALSICLRWMALHDTPQGPGRFFLRAWSYLCLLLGG